MCPRCRLLIVHDPVKHKLFYSIPGARYNWIVAAWSNLHTCKDWHWVRGICRLRKFWHAPRAATGAALYWWMCVIYLIRSREPELRPRFCGALGCGEPEM